LVILPFDEPGFLLSSRRRSHSNFPVGVEAMRQRLTLRKGLPGPAQSVMAICEAQTHPVVSGVMGRACHRNKSGATFGRINIMLKSIWISAIAIGAFAVCAVVAPLPGQRAIAQSAGSYVNAVDIDVVPAERDNYLAAITENGMAAAKEPGCRRFDILNLASDPNHFFLYEVYDNEAAFQAHRASEHFKKYAATTSKMVAKRETRTMSVMASNSVAK
jgi:(4S)-4-hydroxy-5-phosphonooxypentane-2,3-dione isomerase